MKTVDGLIFISDSIYSTVNPFFRIMQIIVLEYVNEGVSVVDGRL